MVRITGTSCTNPIYAGSNSSIVGCHVYADGIGFNMISAVIKGGNETVICGCTVYVADANDALVTFDTGTTGGIIIGCNDGNVTPGYGGAAAALLVGSRTYSEAATKAHANILNGTFQHGDVS